MLVEPFTPRGGRVKFGGRPASNDEKTATTRIYPIEVGDRAPAKPTQPGPQIELPGAPDTKKMRGKEEKKPIPEQGGNFIWTELEWLLTSLYMNNRIDKEGLEKAKKKWLRDDGKVKEELVKRLHEACEKSDPEAIDAARAIDYYYDYLLSPRQYMPPPAKGPVIGR